MLYRWFFRGAAATAAALLLAAGGAAPSRAAGALLVITMDGNGNLIAISRGGQLDLTVGSEHGGEGCMIDTIKRCYIFTAADGAATPPRASSSVCVTSPDELPSGSAVCPASGIKSITIVSEGVGGTVSVNGGMTGRLCPSLPVTITRKAGVVSNIQAKNGCVETVLCTTGFSGAVEVDAKDKVKGCRYYLRDDQPVGTP